MSRGRRSIWLGARCTLLVVMLAGCVGVVGPGSSPPSMGDDSSGTVHPLASDSSPLQDRPHPSIGPTLLLVGGISDKRSQSFVADNSWSISWSYIGTHLFSIQVIPEAVDEYGDLVVSGAGPSSGSQPMYRAGRYVLRVIGRGEWDIEVTDLENQPWVALPETVAGSGPSNTPGFSLEGSAVISWSLKSSAPLGLELVPLSGLEPNLLADRQDGTSGCVVLEASGDFYLHVVTETAWRLDLGSLEGEAVCPT
jgi:hypothetical protein